MKIGISCFGMVYKFGYERAFALCRESGFDTVEFNLLGHGEREKQPDIYSASEDQFEAYFTNIGRLAREAGLEISSTHGREAGYTNDEEHCEYMRWVSERDLAATRFMGAPACVIHPVVRNCWTDQITDKNILTQVNTRMYRDLLPFAEKHGVKIGLESMGKIMVNCKRNISYFGSTEDIKKQLELLNSPYTTVCVDSGHTNEAHYLGADSPGDMIRALGSDVTVLHLHDNSGTVDLHAPPICDRRDCVEWPDVFDALEEIGYTGSYNFELRTGFYGDALEDAVRFYGKWLRYFVENKGRTY